MPLQPYLAPVPSPRGVFDVDPHNPPQIPIGARAIQIVDSSGRIIAYGWVVAEHADDRMRATSWDWLDERDVTPPSFARPRLVR